MLHSAWAHSFVMCVCKAYTFLPPGVVNVLYRLLHHGPVFDYLYPYSCVAQMCLLYLTSTQVNHWPMGCNYYYYYYYY
jgi:hypothetical protein